MAEASEGCPAMAVLHATVVAGKPIVGSAWVDAELTSFVTSVATGTRRSECRVAFVAIATYCRMNDDACIRHPVPSPVSNVSALEAHDIQSDSLFSATST
jgi:hypothetical protein